MRKKKIWMEKVKELDSATSISWLEHRTTYSCEGPAKHGLIGEDSFTKSVCQHCVLEKEKDPNFVIVKPTTKLERIRMRAPIGRFHQIMNRFTNTHYREHRWQVDAMHQCIKQRNPDVLLAADRWSVILVRDYTDRISPEYNNEAMTSGMGGGKSTVGMEGFLMWTKNDKGEMEMNWRGFLSDWRQQDSRTSYANAYKNIKHLQSQGFLPKGGRSVLYIRSDGCPAQYKCANAMRLVGLLALVFEIQIDWMVTAPHHGKKPSQRHCWERQVRHHEWFHPRFGFGTKR